MFQNNLSSSHPYDDCLDKPLCGLTAKSSVKVSFPVQDEEVSCQEHETVIQTGVHKDPSEVLNRFRNYVKFHAIEADDIWEEKASLQYLLFADLVQKKVGFRFTTEEILTLKAISHNANLSPSCFSTLDIWPQVRSLKKSILTAASQKSLFQIRKKRNSSIKNAQKAPSRISEQSVLESKQFTRTGGEKSGEKSRMKTTCDQLTKTFLKSGFVNQQCKDTKIEALREDLEMNALEKKWELVVMAGEMNKWIHDSLSDNDKDEHRIPVQFKIVSQADNFIIVKVDELKQEQIIPEVVFYKKYHALKKKQPACKDLEPKINKAIVGAACNSGKTTFNKYSQRDKELNEALLHIMRIKNVLQFQHKILTESAINT